MLADCVGAPLWHGGSASDRVSLGLIKGRRSMKLVCCNRAKTDWTQLYGYVRPDTGFSRAARSGRNSPRSNRTEHMFSKLVRIGWYYFPLCPVGIDGDIAGPNKMPLDCMPTIPNGNSPVLEVALI